MFRLQSLRLKSALTSGLLTLIVCLMIMAMALAMNNIQADAAGQADTVTAQESAYYAPLTDTPPQRDITSQRFAPLTTIP